LQQFEGKWKRGDEMAMGWNSGVKVLAHSENQQNEASVKIIK
jgi:hypothetical protein